MATAEVRSVAQHVDVATRERLVAVTIDVVASRPPAFPLLIRASAVTREQREGRGIYRRRCGWPCSVPNFTGIHLPSTCTTGNPTATPF